MKSKRLPLMFFALLWFLGCDKQSPDIHNVDTFRTTVKEVIWEERTEVPTWAATIIQHKRGPKNSDNIVIDLELIDKTGTKTVLAENIVGPIVIFENERIVAACEAQGSIVIGANPFFLTLNGNRRNGPKHAGYVRHCGSIEASGLLLIHYNIVRDNGKPYNFVRVLDTTGAIVIEKEMSTSGQLEVSSSGKVYRVNIPEPDLPG